MLKDIRTQNSEVLKLKIYDARSYIAAVANQTKNGGFENVKLYEGCEILFNDIGNIHDVRKSYNNLIDLLCSNSEKTPTMAQVEETGWFYIIR